MVKKTFALLLLVCLIFVGGCTTKKDNENSQAISSSNSIISSTGSANSDVNSVTDPYGNPLVGLENKTNFPLYAALKTDNIYLYGIKPYGMVLYQNNAGTYFDWPGLTPRNILPEMSYLDYDNDGKKELAVTLYVGSGTQYSIMDLHILKIVEPSKDNKDTYKPKYTDYSLLGDDVSKWMTIRFTGTLSADKKTINLNFNGKMYQVDNWTDYPQAGKYNGIGFGDIVKFSFDNNRKIHVRIAVGATYENVAQLHPFGEIDGEVRFTGSGFVLKNCSLNIKEINEN